MIREVSRCRGQYFRARAHGISQFSRATRNGEMPQSAGNKCFCGTWVITRTEATANDICSSSTDADKREKYEQENISALRGVHKSLASVLMHHLHVAGNVAGRP